MIHRAAHPNLGRLFSHIPPDRLAAIDIAPGTGGRALTYGALDAACDAVARGLAHHGVAAGDRVGILCLNRTAFFEILFGTLRIGAVPVPVNIKLPRERLRSVLDDAGVRVVFTEAAFREVADAPSRVIVDIDTDLATFKDEGAFEAIVPEPKHVSMQLYTSGTTGAPKGVLLTHAGQIWAAETLAAHRRLVDSDRALLSAPFFHKNAIVAMKTGLLVGSTLLVLPKFDIEATIAAIRDHGATMLTGVPTMMAMLLQRRDLLKDVDTSAVRVISMGSAPASDTLLADISATFPSAEVHMNYGTTEGGPIMTGWYSPDGSPQPPTSVGWPISGCDYRFVGGQSERDGELWVRNPGVALGYYGMPNKTAERFIDGWYRTGDVLRHGDDGWFYFIGRTDDMFVVGGENVYPQEVETLLESHPSVAQATVMPFAHEMKGMVPYAFVVPAAGCTPSEDELKAFTIENGPAYAHPRRVFIIPEIPLTGTNKVDKEQLKALAAG